MKIIKIFALIVLSLMFAISCDESESLISGVEGGLVDINNPSVNYVVGNPGPYTASVRIYQGTVKTTKLTVMKTFHTIVPSPTEEDPNAVIAVQSNTVLMATINVDDLTKESFKSFSFTFDDLIADLKVDAASLPISDGDYQIGDYWEFEYVATVNNGTEVYQDKTTKVTVATRFAGRYRFVEGAYYRIGVLSSTGDYWDPEYLIESVDAKTYKMNGVSAWMDQIVYFQIEDDGRITYPLEWDGEQLINGQPLISCESNLSDLSTVHCSTSNYIVKDDVDGKDQLIMSFGYLTGGSASPADDGPRSFYQVMEKIIE
ncbi:MAG TPA: hypothetical protein VFC65_07305 [Prolixibacteraceae bacterium]|nr:hypothetical protein [Prolixibacteraceae bacterium]